ncbi:cellulase family glycosylhydrolase [Sphaerisporangium sp. TRM90804]|uniref:cellulase family glycosylhydrolase n=1 Tax=Sphaerisporangium sp. TRM90804 TaxID=3031113 RepID=UPI00244C14DA|nr:cellulase family glycosylhydrolase [Sphaerisporangium sp. TRM90804]MDH2425460.1 cellulase family glycosylhydrolase [Sphaerisporangium sp. TRM90804]
MTRRLWTVRAAVLSLLAVLGGMLVAAQPASAAVGLRVSGTNIVEASGGTFVIRGVSHPHAWYPSQLATSMAGIKLQGANAVRVVLSGGRWPANSASDVAGVIAQCKANRLICILENHDTTGYGEQSGAVTLDAAVDYWVSIQSALTGQENHVIINIGNEPIGNNSVTPGWAQATSAAITRMRSAGFQHLLMVDAPNWGQDWSFTMRDNAASVAAADPQRNTVFSIHMYGVFDTAAEINSYLDAFRTAGLPLVIGEFGHNHSDGNPDEDTIMAQAQARGLGYIGWSWSGNSSDVAYLDMVNNFNSGSLTSWGTRIFTGANGIRPTAREAAIYGGGNNQDTTSPTTPGTPSASAITSSGATLTWTASTDAGGSGLAGYLVYREQGTTDTLLGQSATNSITLTGLSAATRYQVYVRARDGAGNLSGNSGIATFTTTTGGGGGCSVSTTGISQWGTGYVQPVTVTNTGTSATTGWTVTFTLPSGHQVTGYWGATLTTSGQTVTARNAGYNGTLAPGAGTTFGFQASRPNGDTQLPSGYTCTAS